MYSIFSDVTHNKRSKGRTGRLHCPQGTHWAAPWQCVNWHGAFTCDLTVWSFLAVVFFCLYIVIRFGIYPTWQQGHLSMCGYPLWLGTGPSCLHAGILALETTSRVALRPESSSPGPAWPQVEAWARLEPGMGPLPSRNFWNNPPTPISDCWESAHLSIILQKSQGL